ncbi:MAG: hypothetical protein HDR43_01450 [Mycoplasma sp.]|nr:hypothetical protein [Mycoplasma sp.]
MRRNKIISGWASIPNKKGKFEKTRIPWTAKYEVKHTNEDGIISKVIQFIIRISLVFAFDRKNITKAKLRITANNTYSILSSSKFKFIPSSVAFYLFLSIIPITVIVISIVSLVDITWKDFLIIDILSYLIPGFQAIFTESVNWNTPDILIIIIFMLSSIWFASKGINKFSDSFTELYGFENKQNFLVKRIKSIFIVIFISLFFSGVALSFIPIMKLVYSSITNTILYQTILYLLSFAYLLVFGYIGIGILFKYISPIRLKWSYLNLGILTSLIPLILFILLFSSICKLLNYEKFGAIGSFLYIMLFVQYISYFLHAGIIINSSYYKTNVYQNIEVRKSLISKKIGIWFKNIWTKIKFINRK